MLAYKVIVSFIKVKVTDVFSDSADADTDATDATDYVDSTDSTDSADLTDLADSDLNPHLDKTRIIIIVIISSLFSFNRV